VNNAHLVSQRRWPAGSSPFIKETAGIGGMLRAACVINEEALRAAEERRLKGVLCSFSRQTPKNPGVMA
jgi:hypothetical protein